MQITGAQAMIKCLLEEQVDVVFGYPGAAIVPFYDALSKSKIRHVLTRTEQGAGHAAGGYARITGRAGVCIATSGPGATNLFTAIATAYSDSIPMVAVTGQVATYDLGHDVFQEVDTTGAAQPFSKYTCLVKAPEELPRVFKEAFYIANSGRKGPVLIDVPIDIQTAFLKYSYPKNVNIRGYKPCILGHPLQVKKVVQALGKARKPLICCGGGVILAGAEEAVRTLSTNGNIPVVSTMMGIGAVSPGHPLYFGMVGRNGSKAANTAVLESDLLIITGARVGDRAIERPGRLEHKVTTVHIDIDTAEIGKNMDTTIPLVGDAKSVIEQISAMKPYGNYDKWVDYLTSICPDENIPVNAKLDPNMLVKKLCEKLPEDSVYVADVGLNQIWSARNYAGNGRFLTSGGMGTMGYSLPAAIGAKLASPEKTVVAACGDGAFQMCLNELATVKQNGLGIKILLFNNGRLGMIKQIQGESFNGNEYAVNIENCIDYSLIAQAYGIDYLRISAREEAEEALEKFLSHGKAFLLECIIDSEVTV